METKVRMHTLNSTDNLPIRMETESYDGKDGDTKVTLMSAGVLCWVSGEEKEKFLEELNNLIDKYRI